ncbi:MAG: hypothetical protein IIB44_00440 [Candidatus Marinimicrobia bacterium]|nr:hypothetical protein [Candidatus Neomarinimicrobiota bacterium]MCH8067717.1 hypothetical protein [Candidatus Neomarinimicrobiota bacterium]
MSIRVAFPYFRHAYHVYHSAPTAFELSLLDTNLDVQFFSAYKETTDLLNELSSLYPNHRCTIHNLPQLPMFRYFNITNRLFPKPQKMIDRHAHRFENMDVIVDTSDSLLRLINVHGLTNPKYISVFHGAGDRNREFLKRLRKFQFFLLYGSKKYQRLYSLGLLTENNWAMVGYPKFDVASPAVIQAKPLFYEKRPIVLYNPHFERRLSSWYIWGRKILDYFTRSSRYNLIFAPHVELKGRKKRWLSLKKYKDIPHIHVDLGSRSLIDMTYTRLADIFLSDVSSQICEFLLDPRPCVFLNSHKVSWENNLYYLQWHLGPVIENLSQLDGALKNAFQTHEQYLAAQSKYFSDSIDLTDIPSGMRSAKAIYAFIRSEFNQFK